MLRALTLGYLGTLTLSLGLRVILGDTVWWVSLLNTFALYLFLPLPLALITAFAQRLPVARLASILLSLVALFWFGAYFWPDPVPEPAGVRLTVVSYNMHALEAGLEPYLLNHEPDIVLLQEVTTSYPATLSATLLERYPYRAAQPRRHKGNMILSRYPIEQVEDLNTFGDYAPQRAEIVVGDARIAVYNVHLTWPIGERRLPERFTPGPLYLLSAYDDRQRNADLDELIGLLEREPLPFIVGGDFNLSQTAAGYSRLTRVANDAYRTTEAGWGHTWRLHPRLPPLLRIDYLWCDKASAPVSVTLGPTLASDHLPLYGEFALPTTQQRSLSETVEGLFSVIQ